MVKTRANSKTQNKTNTKQKSDLSKNTTKINKKTKKNQNTSHKKNVTKREVSNVKRAKRNANSTEDDVQEQPVDLWQAESVLIKCMEDIR